MYGTAPPVFLPIEAEINLQFLNFRVVILINLLIPKSNTLTLVAYINQSSCCWSEFACLPLATYVRMRVTDWQKCVHVSMAHNFAPNERKRKRKVKGWTDGCWCLVLLDSSCLFYSKGLGIRKKCRTRENKEIVGITTTLSILILIWLYVVPYLQASRFRSVRPNWVWLAAKSAWK